MNMYRYVHVYMCYIVWPYIVPYRRKCSDQCVSLSKVYENTEFGRPLACLGALQSLVEHVHTHDTVYVLCPLNELRYCAHNYMHLHVNVCLFVSVGTHLHVYIA